MGLFLPIKKKNIIYLLTVCIIIIGYSYTYFPRFNSKGNIKSEESLTLNNQTIQIDKFVFYNSNHKEINIKSEKPKFILTWNKTCVPCKEAIKDLKLSFSENPNFDYYLINIPFRKDDFEVSVIESILKENINDVSILNDVNNHFANDLKIYSVPIFLMLDMDNNITYYKVGYNTSDKNNLMALLNDDN